MTGGATMIAGRQEVITPDSDGKHSGISSEILFQCLLSSNAVWGVFSIYIDQATVN
jgi:hypothetical protein